MTTSSHYICLIPKGVLEVPDWMGAILASRAADPLMLFEGVYAVVDDMLVAAVVSLAHRRDVYEHLRP
jgi:hypothetical protein